jgi:hypothetical protein
LLLLSQEQIQITRVTNDLRRCDFDSQIAIPAEEPTLIEAVLRADVPEMAHLLDD